VDFDGDLQRGEFSHSLGQELPVANDRYLASQL
jgi:hypothetical protein